MTPNMSLPIVYDFKDSAYISVDILRNEDTVKLLSLPRISTLPEGAKVALRGKLEDLKVMAYPDNACAYKEYGRHVHLHEHECIKKFCSSVKFPTHVYTYI
jgi:hypothetical protein